MSKDAVLPGFDAGSVTDDDDAAADDAAWDGPASFSKRERRSANAKCTGDEGLASSLSRDAGEGSSTVRGGASRPGPRMSIKRLCWIVRKRSPEHEQALPSGPAPMVLLNCGDGRAGGQDGNRRAAM